MAVIHSDLTQAQHHLSQGDLVAIPTETVYGLAGNMHDVSAVEQIFQVKQRPSFDPLIVHVGHQSQVDALVRHFPEKARKLAEAYWPGPLTLLLDKSDQVSDRVTASLPKVALRIPNHPLTLSLLQRLDFPVVAPSANPFGYISPTSSAHVQAQLGDRIPLILEGGPCQVGVESTIVGFEADRVLVYRLGGVPVAALEQTLQQTIEVVHGASQTPQAPGGLDSHYAPRKPLMMGHIETLWRQYGGVRCGVMTFDRYHEGIPHAQQHILAPNGTLEQAAQRLFATLRALDGWDIDCIIGAYVPSDGLGAAINDRLSRASHRCNIQ